MIAPDQLIRRVLGSVDGVVVDAEPHETYAMILHAAVCLAGIALMRFHGPERENLLDDLEGRVRQYIALVEARRVQH
jgi:hypothetical protein